MDDIQKMFLQTRRLFHGATLLLICILGWQYFFKAQPYGLLDYGTLPFHEFGHQVAGLFFGPFFTALAGTLGQLAFPVGFTIYFFYRRDLFAASLCLFWIGQNLVNVSVYMRDARFMLLPLFGGDEHDWNFLFGQMRLLNKSVQIADGVRVAATLVMLAGLAGMTWQVWRPSNPTLQDS